MADKISFFRSYYEAIKDFPAEEYKKAMNALFAYSFEGVDPDDLTGMTKVFFCMAKPIVDKGRVSAANGENGGRPSKTDTDKNQQVLDEKPTGFEENNQQVSEEKPTGSDSPRNRSRSKEKDSGVGSKDKGLGAGIGEGERTSEKDKGVCVGNTNARARKFTPPTADEVRAYCIERHNAVDAERFVDYYQSNGWHVGKNPMRDWKAAVRTWERGDNGGQSYQPRARSGTTSQLDIAANILQELREEDAAHDT